MYASSNTTKVQMVTFESSSTCTAGVKTSNACKQLTRFWASLSKPTSLSASREKTKKLQELYNIRESPQTTWLHSKSHTRAKLAHTAGVYLGFCSMKPTRIATPSGWDASRSPVTPQHFVTQYPFILLGGERHCESKVSCPRTQNTDPGQVSNLDCSVWSPAC